MADGGGLVAWDSQELTWPAPFDEVVLSWNTDGGWAGRRAEFLVAAVYPDRQTRFYSLGRWAVETNGLQRTSVSGQKDDSGEVSTDVLRLVLPATRLRIRVLHGAGPIGMERLAVSVFNSRSNPPARGPDRTAWGQSLVLPQLSQHAYPGARGWCSPTSVAMILGYWAGELRQPELAREVPIVAAGVFDPAWNGTGNWSFNMAYAGGTAQLDAYAVHLRDLRDLEELIGRRIPAAISVSLNRLRGRPKGREDGHLVVVSGFTPEGDVWVHDPDTSHPPVPGRTVRRIYPRDHVDGAWQSSHRMTYLILPQGLDVRMGRWQGPVGTQP